MFLYYFLLCKAVYGIIYTYKYVTDFVNNGIKLLDVGTKDMNSGHTTDFIELNVSSALFLLKRRRSFQNRLHAPYEGVSKSFRTGRLE